MTTISGTVTHDGEGLPGAWVFLADSEARTDGNGGYTLTAPAGPETMVVFKEGFRTEARPIEVPASGRLTESFELAPNPLYPGG